MRTAIFGTALALALGTLGAGSTLAGEATVVDDNAIADESDGANWLAYGKTHSEKRYSPLDQIDVESVSGLGIEWFVDLPDDRTLIGTPLVGSPVWIDLDILSAFGSDPVSISYQVPDRTSLVLDASQPDTLTRTPLAGERSAEEIRQIAATLN